jgi:hypothetical protein
MDLNKPRFRLVPKVTTDRTMTREQYYEFRHYMRLSERLLRHYMRENDFERRLEDSSNNLMIYGTSITEWITPKV